MRTIATRLLPNPHCLSSHAVHRIRHGPAVRSSRCHGCARAGLRSAPAPLPTGAARLLLQRMVDPRRPRPSCRPRATAPECDGPDGSFRAAATASPGTFGSPTPPPVPGARPDPLPSSTRIRTHEGHMRRRIVSGRSVMCHSRAPPGWKISSDRIGPGESAAPWGDVFQQLRYRIDGRHKAVACSARPFHTESAFYEGVRGSARVRRWYGGRAGEIGPTHSSAHRARPPTPRRRRRRSRNLTCEHAAQRASRNQDRVNGVPVTGHI